jgi:alpha-tubulin suppressor-like RCC1 family protein
MIRKILFSILAALSASLNSQTIEAGGFHTDILCSDSTVYACGTNYDGQLGVGDNAQHSGLSHLSLTGIVAVANSSTHTLFLKGNGTVWATGSNFFGELGDGTTNDQYSPVQAGISGVKAIACGMGFSLFLKIDGTVWACGNNSAGQLGNGTYSDSPVPVQVSGLSGVIAIDAGNLHSLFLKSDSTLRGCGAGPEFGSGNNSYQLTPVQPAGVAGLKFRAISAGDYHSIFLKNDGTVLTCGLNFYGQLANGTNSATATPTPAAPSLSNIVAVSAGSLFSLFLKSDGTAWAAGANDGRLGDGTGTFTNSPVQCTVANVTAISAGALFSLFKTSDGKIYGCGSNSFNQLYNPNNTTFTTPVLIESPCPVIATGISEVSAGISLRAYPNPINDVLTIDGEKENDSQLRMELLNTLGKICFEGPFARKTDLNALAPGIYFLRIKENNSFIYSQKIIKQ